MLNRRFIRRQSGDTLIEVLFAISVFSMIVVASLSLMNQGILASQRALEITVVRQQMESQAETLRFLHSAYVQAYDPSVTYNVTDAVSTPAEEYYKIIQHIRTTGSASGLGSGTCGSPPGNSFILSSRLATVVTNSAVFARPNTYAEVVYNAANTVGNGGSRGIWIEGVRSPVTGATGFIDFHVRACWAAPNSIQPVNLGTIVRLYEPRG